MLLEQEKNTSDCLVDSIEQISKSVDNGEFAKTLFLDLSIALILWIIPFFYLNYPIMES